MVPIVYFERLRRVIEQLQKSYACCCESDELRAIIPTVPDPRSRHRHQ